MAKPASIFTSRSRLETSGLLTCHTLLAFVSGQIPFCRRLSLYHVSALLRSGNHHAIEYHNALNHPEFDCESLSSLFGGSVAGDHCICVAGSCIASFAHLLLQWKDRRFFPAAFKLSSISATSPTAPGQKELCLVVAAVNVLGDLGQPPSPEWNPACGSPHGPRAC